MSVNRIKFLLIVVLQLQCVGGREIYEKDIDVWCI